MLLFDLTQPSAPGIPPGPKRVKIKSHNFGTFCRRCPEHFARLHNGEAVTSYFEFKVLAYLTVSVSSSASEEFFQIAFSSDTGLSPASADICFRENTQTQSIYNSKENGPKSTQPNLRMVKQKRLFVCI